MARDINSMALVMALRPTLMLVVSAPPQEPDPPTVFVLPRAPPRNERRQLSSLLLVLSPPRRCSGAGQLLVHTALLKGHGLLCFPQTLRA